MKSGERGSGILFMDPDADTARAWFRAKSRRLESKTTTVRDAVQQFVADGDYVGIGGVLHEPNPDRPAARDRPPRPASTRSRGP